jgi:carbon starvation protein
MLIAAFFAIRRALRSEQPTTHEVGAALREETGRG